MHLGDLPVGAGDVGTEWLVDAHGCAAAPLRSVDVLSTLFTRIVADLSLRPVGDAVWHVFPGAGGVTGFLLLSESHLSCHTFPERGLATFNLYCCRPRPEWAWTPGLAEMVQASRVVVHRVPRGAGVALDTDTAARLP